MILPSHAASVLRPAVHGTVGFSAPARRRWYFAPVPRHSKDRPSSRFRGIASPSKRLTAAVFHGRH
nr:hypothetical protein [Klebsiella michiganensis]